MTAARTAARESSGCGRDLMHHVPPRRGRFTNHRTVSGRVVQVRLALPSDGSCLGRIGGIGTSPREHRQGPHPALNSGFSLPCPLRVRFSAWQRLLDVAELPEARSACPPHQRHAPSWQGGFAPLFWPLAHFFGRRSSLRSLSYCRRSSRDWRRRPLGSKRSLSRSLHTCLRR